MNVLSLFDGMSCGQIAFDKLGIKFDGVENTYFSAEIDKYAMQITKKNYPNTVFIGNVFDIDYSKLPKIDFVIGGSPCTFWSISKKDREITSKGVGFNLFMQYVKAVKELNPKYFLYENNFSIHKDIKSAISEKLGVNEIMINSALVSAQQRKRCYWTNIQNKENLFGINECMIEQPKDKGILLKDIIDGQAFLNDRGTLILAGHAEEIKGHDYNKRVYSPEGKAPTLAAASGGNLGPKITCQQIGRTTTGRYEQKTRVYGTGGKSPSILAHTSGGWDDVKIAQNSITWRKLTPLECERLQTVPDNFTAHVSNTQRYKMLGNGWTVDVIAHIFRGLK